MKPKLLFLGLFLGPMISLNMHAQVGINKDKPDTCAILQVSDTNRGVILPQISSDNAINFPSLSDGLLFYNTSIHRFKYFNATRQWECVNPWNADDTTLISTNATVKINNTLSAQTVNAATVNATEGTGIIPIGGIIMWNGSTVPSGWALCDGSTVNGITTPDLKGRFIVASGKNSLPDSRETDNTAYTVDQKGGINKYALTVAEMPSHNHTITDPGHKHSITGEVMQKEGSSTQSVVALDTQDDPSHGNVSFTDKISNAYTNISVNTNGGNGSHENRPAYYVLAFIMRIK